MTTVIVGNPKRGSRTRDAAVRLHEQIRGTEPRSVIEVADLGARLLAWGDPMVKEAVTAVQQAPFVIVASPTFKATYTGLLKIFLDHFSAGDGFGGVVVPLMLGAGEAHSNAPDDFLVPVLRELGATLPAPGLYLHDSSYLDDGVLEAYADAWRDAVNASVRPGQV